MCVNTATTTSARATADTKSATATISGSSETSVRLASLSTSHPVEAIHSPGSRTRSVVLRLRLVEDTLKTDRRGSEVSKVKQTLYLVSLQSARSRRKVISLCLTRSSG